MKRQSHPGAPFSAVTPEDPNQFFLFTDWEGYDWFRMTSRQKRLYATHWAEFLEVHRPDVVHFQHMHIIGWDVVSHTRRVLPEVPILFTLHEYLSICHRDGQMLRRSGELCTHASPRRCHECFPDISPGDFFLRERFIKSHMQHVDMFLAPSRFLLERYAAWGIPREKLRFEDYGRLPVAGPAGEEREPRPRNRLAFFGQVNQYKGLDVLLQAMKIVVEEHPDVHLWIHGANLSIQSDELKQEFLSAVEELKDNVTFTGAYDHSRLPDLMSEADWVMVPSRWWENSPLVIQEAFLYGRPVICSDIGGMAEKVRDGVDGLHFRVGDPVGLAEAIGRAVSTPGLWDELRAGIGDVFAMDEHVENLTRIYHDLERSKAQAAPLAPAAATGA
jgi:glycosyltransferase involved in cell wall biosynthesis